MKDFDFGYFGPGDASDDADCDADSCDSSEDDF